MENSAFVAWTSRSAPLPVPLRGFFCSARTRGPRYGESPFPYLWWIFDCSPLSQSGAPSGRTYRKIAPPHPSLPKGFDAIEKRIMLGGGRLIEPGQDDICRTIGGMDIG